MDLDTVVPWVPFHKDPNTNLILTSTSILGLAGPIQTRTTKVEIHVEIPTVGVRERAGHQEWGMLLERPMVVSLLLEVIYWIQLHMMPNWTSPTFFYLGRQDQVIYLSPPNPYLIVNYLL